MNKLYWNKWRFRLCFIISLGANIAAFAFLHSYSNDNETELLPKNDGSHLVIGVIGGQAPSIDERPKPVTPNPGKGVGGAPDPVPDELVEDTDYTWEPDASIFTGVPDSDGESVSLSAPDKDVSTVFDQNRLDEIPVRTGGSEPEYPLKARRLGKEGTVVLRLLINPQGTVDKVEIVSEPSAPGLNEAAVKAAYSWEFTPPTINGGAVYAWVKTPVVFRLA